jgi:hypothetical protein
MKKILRRMKFKMAWAAQFKMVVFFYFKILDIKYIQNIFIYFFILCKEPNFKKKIKMRPFWISFFVFFFYFLVSLFFKNMQKFQHFKVSDEYESSLKKTRGVGIKNLSKLRDVLYGRPCPNWFLFISSLGFMK